MVLFADGGLFFNEWYWGPIGHAIVALPFVGIVAFAAALAMRRWKPGHRVWLAVAIIVGGEALILGGGLYSEYQRPIRESRVVARTLDFTAYEPRPLPPRFVLTSSRAGPGPRSLGVPIFYASYDAGAGFANTTQEPRPAPGADSAAGRCLLPDAGCRKVRTPKGLPVLIARNKWGVDASAVLGGTLVSVLTVDVGEPDVLAYYDALEPVAADDIRFTGA